MRLADSIAGGLAQSVWYGVDAPGAVPTVFALRRAVTEGLPESVEFDAVAEWASPAIDAVSRAGNLVELEALLLGVVVSSMVLGAKLQETNGT